MERAEKGKVMDLFKNKTGSLVVEAVQVGEDNASEISNWANGAQIIEEKHPLTGQGIEGLNIKTASGMKRASFGDWVIKYGSLFTVAPADQFMSKYTPVVSEVAEVMSNPEPTPIAKAMSSDPFEGMTRFGEGPKP
jgi:hypothetical protein